MDDKLDSGAYNPDLVTQQDDGEQPVAQSAPPNDAGEEPSTDGSGGQPPDDNAPPSPSDEGGRKRERGWAGQIFDFLRDQFGVGGPGLSARGIGGSDHEPGGLPEQAGEELEEQPGREPTGLPTQASMGREMQDEVPGQPSAQPPQMEAQPPVPYTGQPGQPDAVPDQRPTPRGTPDQSSDSGNGALPGVAKQFVEPYQDHTAWNTSKQIANEAPYDTRPGHWQTQAEQPRGDEGQPRRQGRSPRSGRGAAPPSGGRRGGRGRRSEAEPVEGRQETAFGLGTETPTTVGRGESAQGFVGGSEEPTTEGGGPNAPRPIQYLQGHGAEDSPTRTARENKVASQLPPGTDMNIVRSEALRQNMEQNGPEAAGPQLQNHRDQYNKFKAMAGAAWENNNPTGAASLYNEAHTFMPDGYKVTASPGANGGMNLNIQDLTGGKPPQDIQLSEDQFRELTHMRAGEFDHVFERGIDKNAADLARTPGMPRGALDAYFPKIPSQERMATLGMRPEERKAWEGVGPGPSRELYNSVDRAPWPGMEMRTPETRMWFDDHSTGDRENYQARLDGRLPHLAEPNPNVTYAANTNRMPNAEYNAVARGERGTTVPQVQGMRRVENGQLQRLPVPRLTPEGSSSTVSKGNYPQPPSTPGQGDATSKGDYLRGQPRDQGFPMGDAALRPDPTSAENRAARALPNGTPEQLGRLADQYRAADRTMNDRLNAQVGSDPNAGNYRPAIGGMPPSSLNPSKADLASRGLDLKEQEINRKTTQGNQHLDYLIDRNTGQLNERMMQHLDQANGRNISNAIRAAAAKSAAGIALSAADNAALARAAELAMNPATHGALNTRPNTGGGAPAPSGRGAAQPRGEWRTNTATGERRWFPAQ